jgi:hypothetical protein
MAYQTPASASTLPAPVAQLAYGRQLGGHVATYPAKRPPLITVAGLTAFAGGCLVLAGFGVVTGVWALAILGFIFAVPFVVLLFRDPIFSRKLAAKQVYVFEHGFIHTAASGPVGDYRWDSIASVQQKIVERYTNGIHTGTTYLYTVTRQDGAVVKLTQFYDRIAELGQTIAREVTRVHLPRAAAAIEHGQTVPFGDLAISGAGIVSSRHGLLPWGELEEVQLQQGYVKLRKAGRWLSWSNKPASEIPNLFVFLTLADQLQRAAHRR